MSFFDWGSGESCSQHNPPSHPARRPPSANHGKHKLLLYVLANIQYSDLGNLSNRHENLHFLLYVPSNTQYYPFPEIHIHWKYYQKTIHLQIWESKKNQLFLYHFCDIGCPEFTSRNHLFHHYFLEKYVRTQTRNLHFSFMLQGNHLHIPQKPLEKTIKKQRKYRRPHKSQKIAQAPKPWYL